MKRPVIVIDFTDELARQLTSEVSAATVRNYIESEACVDIACAAKLLGISVSEARKHAKKWPVVELGERSHRYKTSDIIAYRDKKTVKPKH